MLNQITVKTIRRKYGNNQIEVIYRGAESLNVGNAPVKVVSDQEYKKNRRAVLEILGGAANAEVLSELVKYMDIVSYQELIPRMNDIFIKLVSNS